MQYLYRLNIDVNVLLLCVLMSKFNSSDGVTLMMPMIMQRLGVLNCEGSFNGVKFKPVIMQRLGVLNCEGSSNGVKFKPMIMQRLGVLNC